MFHCEGNFRVVSAMIFPTADLELISATNALFTQVTMI